MTAISLTHAGKPDIKHPDRWFATTNRLRGVSGPIGTLFSLTVTWDRSA